MSISLQPIVEAASFRVERLEALVRWHHPVRGLISPTEFISLAEQDCDVIDQLTMWVIEAAARQYLELSALGMARSEEHTSEHQYLMRNSHAAFGWKIEIDTNVEKQNSFYDISNVH